MKARIMMRTKKEAKKWMLARRTTQLSRLGKPTMTRLPQSRTRSAGMTITSSGRYCSSVITRMAGP